MKQVTITPIMLPRKLRPREEGKQTQVHSGNRWIPALLIQDLSFPLPSSGELSDPTAFSPMWAGLPSKCRTWFLTWGLAMISDVLCVSSLQTTLPGLCRSCLTGIPHPKPSLCTEHIHARLAFGSSSPIAPRTAPRHDLPKPAVLGPPLRLSGCPPWPPASVGFPLAHGLGSHLGGQACQSAGASSQILLLASANY